MPRATISKFLLPRPLQARQHSWTPAAARPRSRGAATQHCLRWSLHQKCMLPHGAPVLACARQEVGYLHSKVAGWRAERGATLRQDCVCNRDEGQHTACARRTTMTCRPPGAPPNGPLRAQGGSDCRAARMAAPKLSARPTRRPPSAPSRAHHPAGRAEGGPRPLPGEPVHLHCAPGARGICASERLARQDMRHGIARSGARPAALRSARAGYRNLPPIRVTLCVSGQHRAHV